MSKFAIVSKSDKGIMAKVTQDITLKKGQMIFFNDYEEGINSLVKHNVISQDEANEKLALTRKLDREYGRETIYNLRAGDPARIKEATGSKL